MRTTLIKIVVVITLSNLLSSLAIGQSKTHVTISGRVIDSTTGLPLENVNVFISNTMLGSATNQDGQYEIRRVPLGRYELVVSRIGYELQKFKLRLTELINPEFNFDLVPRVLPAPPIEISAEEIESWEKNLRKFTEQFLGTSQNATECQILNPEVLDFKKDPSSGAFVAMAYAPLQIENRALGYQLYFVLQRFYSLKGEVSYLGDAKFDELIPKDVKETKKWRENRLKAYKGSLHHFLRALHANRYKQEGFIVEHVLNMTQEKYGPFRTEVKGYYLLSSGELPNERRLNFEDFLEVTYTKELEEEAFIDYRLPRDMEQAVLACLSIRRNKRRALGQGNG